MRLLDLDPKWLTKDDRRVGFTFLSPVGRQGNIWWRQSCFAVAMPAQVQWDLFEDENVQHCNPSCSWTISGGIENASFETLTVSPSLDGSAGGLWHGFITSGQIV